MNTLKDRTWFRTDEGAQEGSWARTCVGVGAVAWAAMAVLARMGLAPIGAIELIFLFAPLVIVPLGVELARLRAGAGCIDLVARRFQPIGAGLTVVALWLPPGPYAGVLATGWMIVCAMMGVSGLLKIFSAEISTLPLAYEIPTSGNTGQKWGTRFSGGSRLSMGGIALAIAKIDLAVGGMWFVASRLGLRPMGIQEPIGLLTAVHFHFAGFATALIASATLHFARRHAADRWLRWVALAVVGMPYVVAVGFVASPLLKMVAGAAFSVSVAVLAIFVRSSAKAARDSTARVLLQVAPACVFAGMVLSGIYAIADFRGSDVLPIPQMARTHGVLNAVGFCMCGLLGWLIEFNRRPSENRFTTGITEDHRNHRTNNP